MVGIPQAGPPATAPPWPAAYSLEAVPGPGGAPHVLAQRVQKAAQLLWAHGHLLPDQLQVLWATGPVSHPLMQDPTQPRGHSPGPSSLPGTGHRGWNKPDPQTQLHTVVIFARENWRKMNQKQQSHTSAEEQTRGFREAQEKDCKALGPGHNRMNGLQNCCWLNQCLLIPSLQAREHPGEGREATGQGCTSPCAGAGWGRVSGTPSHLHLQSRPRRGWGHREGSSPCWCPLRPRDAAEGQTKGSATTKHEGRLETEALSAREASRTTTTRTQSTRELRPLHPTFQGPSSPGAGELPGPALFGRGSATVLAQGGPRKPGCKATQSHRFLLAVPLSTAEAKQTYRTEHRGGSVLLNPESWGFATIAGNGLPDSPVTPDLGPQEENRLNEVVCARWPSTDPGLALHQLSGNFPDSQAKTAPSALGKQGAHAAPI